MKKESLVVIILGLFSVIFTVIISDFFYNKRNKNHDVNIEKLTDSNSQVVAKNEKIAELERKLSEQIENGIALKKEIKNLGNFNDSFGSSIVKKNPQVEKVENTVKYDTEINLAKYDTDINLAKYETDLYLALNKFDEDIHFQIFNKLVNLYAIKNLSDSQNDLLKKSIIKMNSFCMESSLIHYKKLDKVNARSFLNRIIKTQHLDKNQKNILNEALKSLFSNIHIVQQKETLTSISKQYNISVSDLLELNPTKISTINDKIKIGDTLMIK